MSSLSFYHRCTNFIKAACTLNDFVKLNPDVFWNCNTPVERLIEGDHEYYLARSRDRLEIRRWSDKSLVRGIMMKTGPKAIGRLLEAYIQELGINGEEIDWTSFSKKGA